MGALKLGQKPSPKLREPSKRLVCRDGQRIAGRTSFLRPVHHAYKSIKKERQPQQIERRAPPPKKTQHIQRADRNVRGKNQRWMQNTKNKGKKKRDIHKPEVPSRIRRTPRARAREGTGGTERRGDLHMNLSVVGSGPMCAPGYSPSNKYLMNVDFPTEYCPKSITCGLASNSASLYVQM